MLIVAVQFRVTPDKREAFADMAKALTVPALAEDGCHFFGFWADLDNTGRSTALEDWETAQHLEAHGNTPHAAVFREASADLGLESMEIKRYPLSRWFPGR